MRRSPPSAPSAGMMRGAVLGLLVLWSAGCIFPKAKPDDSPLEATPTPAPSAPVGEQEPAPSDPAPTTTAPDTQAPSNDPAAPAEPPRVSTASGAFERAAKDLSRGPEGYREAQLKLEEAVRLDPNYVQAWFNLGIVQQGLGATADARASYTKAIDLDPAFIPPYVNLASILRAEGSYDKALDLLDKADRRSPKNPYVRNERVAVLRAMGRTDDAIAEAHRLIKENANDVSAFVNLALGYYDQGNLDMSRLVFEKAFGAFPDLSNDAHVRHAYGMVLLEQGERDLAVAAGFDKALEIKPDYVDALVNRAQIYLEASEPKQAVTLLRKAVEVDPRNREARLTLAVALRRAGDLEAARSQYEILVDQDAADLDALYNLGVLHANYLSNPDQAKGYFERARRASNDSELNGRLDSYIAEAQRSIDNRERTERLKAQREAAEKERAEREAQEKAAGGGEGGAAPDGGDPAPEGGAPAGDAPEGEGGAAPAGGDAPQAPPQDAPPPSGEGG